MFQKFRKGLTTYGPRASCGPQVITVRPVSIFGKSIYFKEIVIT